MWTSVQVFVVLKSAGAVLCPLERMFAVPSTFHGFTFSGTVSRIIEDDLHFARKIPLDTRIAKCGRFSGCDDCQDTIKMVPVSPDYEIFLEAKRRWDGVSAVFIGKWTTLSTDATPERLFHAMRVSSNSTAFSPFDIFYAAKWLDRPGHYQEIAPLPNTTGTTVIRTHSPHGMQAVVFSPAGMEKIWNLFSNATNPVISRPFSLVLNGLVQTGKIVAHSTTPTLMHFDAQAIGQHSSSSSKDLPHLKTAEARAETPPDGPQTRRISSDMTFFHLLLVILIVVIAVCVLVQIGALYAGVAVSSSSSKSPTKTTKTTAGGEIICKRGSGNTFVCEEAPAAGSGG